MRILIVHDWAIVGSGIKQVLADEFGPQEIAEGASVPDGFEPLGFHFFLVAAGVRGGPGRHAGRGGKRRRSANGSDGAFITGSDFLMDGGVTAAYWFGELKPQ